MGTLSFSDFVEPETWDLEIAIHGLSDEGMAEQIQCSFLEALGLMGDDDEM